MPKRWTRSPWTINEKYLRKPHTRHHTKRPIEGCKTFDRNNQVFSFTLEDLGCESTSLDPYADVKKNLQNRHHSGSSWWRRTIDTTSLVRTSLWTTTTFRNEALSTKRIKDVVNSFMCTQLLSSIRWNFCCGFDMRTCRNLKLPLIQNFSIMKKILTS